MSIDTSMSRRNFFKSAAGAGAAAALGATGAATLAVTGCAPTSNAEKE